MAHAFYHAKSSARRFGGQTEDYLKFHVFMDHTKLHFMDARRCNLRFHSNTLVNIANLSKWLVQPLDYYPI